MPDTPVEARGAAPYPSDMEARVGVLEEIAVATKSAIERLDRRIDNVENELRQFRSEVTAEFHGLRAVEFHGLRADIMSEFRAMRAEHRADFRWIVGLGLGTAGALLVVMAHGFHWL